MQRWRKGGNEPDRLVSWRNLEHSELSVTDTYYPIIYVIMGIERFYPIKAMHFISSRVFIRLQKILPHTVSLDPQRNIWGL